MVTQDRAEYLAGRPLADKYAYATGLLSARLLEMAQSYLTPEDRWRLYNRTRDDLTALGILAHMPEWREGRD